MIQDLHGVIRRIEGGWSDKCVLVIGDVMLDRYIWGDVERVSPEAPVPIVRAVHRTERPGGAGNVALNITGLGARAILLGFCGEDPERDALDACLRAGGVEPQMTSVAGHPTTTKLRVLGGQQQMLRLDLEQTDGISPEAYSRLIETFELAVCSANAVVLSDYAKGVLTEKVCQHVIRMSRSRGIPVLVDPKHRSFERYRGATTICPNLGELSAATGIAQKDLDSILLAGQKMAADLDLNYLIATMSEKGIAVLRKDSKLLMPAVARQVFDVSGAGDTVIATLALALADGLEIETAAQLANVAAGIVVSKVGTVPIDRDELMMSLMPEIESQAEEKVLPPNRIQMRVAAWRSTGQSIVFTNGCFDLLHIGHITLLEKARHEGDRLIVAINSDASVRKLKGPTRPIVGERERAHVLAALAAVDAVVVFDEPTPLRLIETLRPDVIVKGGDYNEETVVGAKEARAWSGRVKIVPTVEGFSTTKLIADAMTPAC